jgi:hypothetical protein
MITLTMSWAATALTGPPLQTRCRVKLHHFSNFAPPTQTRFRAQPASSRDELAILGKQGPKGRFQVGLPILECRDFSRYEIVVVDNGSTRRFDEMELRRLMRDWSSNGPRRPARHLLRVIVESSRNQRSNPKGRPTRWSLKIWIAETTSLK